MSHTLGPWKVSDPFQNEYGVSVYAGEIPIATVIQAPSRFDIPRKQELEEIRANAHLIAAAPDLLAALKRCVQEAHLLRPDLESHRNPGGKGGCICVTCLAKVEIAHAEGRTA